MLLFVTQIHLPLRDRSNHRTNVPSVLSALNIKAYKMRRKRVKILTISYSAGNSEANLGFKCFITKYWCFILGIKQKSLYENI